MARHTLLTAAGGAALAALLAGAAPHPAFAQLPADDFQSWTLIAVNKPLGGKYLGYFELQPRLDDNASRFGTLLIRPAVGYLLRKNVSVWIGYAPIFAYQPTTTLENRVFQQLTVTTPAPKVDLINRTRLEQRFLENVDTPSWRARHLVRALFPIDSRRRWSVVAQDELFWNLNGATAGLQPGYDQNRAFLGVSLAATKQVRLEIGHQNVHVRVPTAAPDRNLDVVLTNLFINLP